MQPACLESLAIKVNSPQIRARIIATAHDSGWVLCLAAKESHTGKIAFTAVSVGVSPPFCILRCSSYAESAVRIIEYGMHSVAVLAIEYREVLRSGDYMPASVAVVRLIIRALYICIGGSKSDIIALTVL